MTKATVRRWLWRGAQATGALLVLAIVVALVDGCTAFGRRADGPRRERMQRSPQWNDGRFHNPQPLANDGWGALTGSFKRWWPDVPWQTAQQQPIVSTKAQETP